MLHRSRWTAERGRDGRSLRPASDGADSLGSYPPHPQGLAGVILVHPREATLLLKPNKQLPFKQQTATDTQKMADATHSRTSWDLEARLDSLFNAFWRKLELRQRQVRLPKVTKNLPHKLPSQARGKLMAPKIQVDQKWGIKRPSLLRQRAAYRNPARHPGKRMAENDTTRNLPQPDQATTKPNAQLIPEHEATPEKPANLCKFTFPLQHACGTLLGGATETFGA
ncbi:Hypothetical predicted protein [Pelobates cultripes]|uniref:Uncharacterized protein n=1 Tax=Pelobates cultripes TaxID=61616 RepID=A0AAD1S9M5_PELCU|nr:Hypothetical predicted protein [Pelobates cultripes]